MRRSFHCVNVCAQEQKFPAVLFLFVPYHLLDAFCRIAAARVFQAVRNNHKQSVRGYILGAQPDSRLSSPERAGETAGEDGGRGFEEKVSLCLSDWRGRDALPTEDPAVRRREQWELVQKCFADLYRKNPMRAYVHWLKLRMNLSSTEIKSMLGMSSEANVDQTFSRAVKDMRNLKVQHEERD